MKNIIIDLAKCFGLFIAAAAVNGCASTYQIHSKPEGARVYFSDPGTDHKTYLGATPLAYSKSSLPQQSAFFLTVEKEGYKSMEIPMAATDESRTIVNVSLKPDEDMAAPGVQDLNTTVRRLFKAQQLIYDRQYHSAIIELDQLIKEKPKLVQANVMRGTAYFLLNDKKTALAMWDAALLVDPLDQDLKVFVQKKKAEAGLPEKTK